LQKTVGTKGGVKALESIMIYQKEPEENLGGMSGRICFVSDMGEAAECLLKEKFRLILIHLEKEAADGLKLAAFIRDIPGYFLTPIIFLAWDDRYQYSALHDIHCYDYLVKPIQDSEVIKILYPFLQQSFAVSEEQQMSFRVRGSIYVVNIKDVIYMQCGNRNVDVYTTKGLLQVPYLNFRDTLCKYSHYMIRCHRSTAVNRMFVKRIDYPRKIIELWGEKVEMGREYVNNVRHAFCDN
jgi:DNA-binding LytR/AlgR family response regulator